MKVASAMTTTHARVRAIAGTLAVVFCAAAMFCARFAGARGGPPWESAGAGESESETLAFEGFGRVARAALGNLAVGTHPGYGKDDRVGMYGREGEGVEGGGEDGWTVRTTMFMRAAKVLACASAACAVAAVSAVGEPEGVSKAHVGGVAKATSPRSVVTKPTTKFKQGDSDGAESPRGVGGGSPRTPGSESGRRGGRSLEEVARAKELAKERKRQARAEQELIAKKEEEDRAEIAALVVQERAKREARRAEEELARRMREKEEARVAEALAASLESLEEEKRKLREQQEQEKEREAAEKDTMHSTGSGSGSGSGSKTSSPRVTNGGGKGGGGGGEKKSSPPHKGAPAPPRSQGLTLRFIPTPRTSQAAARAASPAVPPPLQGATVTAAATQAPPPPLPPSRPPPLPSGPPPLPAGPPPAYARKVHPTPEPMHPTFGTGVSGDVTMGAMQPLSPRSPSGGIVPPPGFESLAPAAAPSHRADVSADWSHVDSTIASFLESTADTIEDDDPFIMAARSSNYDDIFSARISDVDITPRLPTSSDNNHAAKKVGTKDSAQPPLPPTPHPEVLAAVLGDVI